MKQNLLTRSILMLVMLVMSVSAWAAHPFYLVDGITYYVDDETNTAEVINNLGFSYSGAIEIPSVITVNGKNYTVVRIDKDAFNRSDVQKVKLPNTVTSIEKYAFSDCKKLTSVDLGGSVKYIEFQAFDGCTSLTSVTGYESVDSLGGAVFRDVPWIDNQPDGVLYIGKTLYKYVGAMPSNTSITVKDGTVQIYAGAFSNCANLVSVTIPNSVKRIDFQAFYNCGHLASISFPQSLDVVEQYAFHNTEWWFKQHSGVVYIQNVLYSYKGRASHGTSITVKDGTTRISDSAFDMQSGITSVTLPNTVTNISAYAFQNCINLESINIPSSVTTIEHSAFLQSGLVSVTIPNSIKEIDNSVFHGCSKLETVYLPHSISSITRYAFWGCSNLKEIICPNETVPYLSETGFYGSSPTIYVPASALEAYKSDEQWGKFSKIKPLEELDDAVAPTMPKKSLTIGDVTYSSIEISWSMATDNFTSQQELKYSVYVDYELYTEKWGVNSCIISGLKPSTAYTIEVRVSDYAGNESIYQSYLISTKAKPVVIEKYPVLIEYTQITSENATDFWGDGGSIKYDPATKTLTLAWADLYSDDDAICIYDDITIKLIGQNTVKGSIYADYTGELTFAGEGSINVKGSYPLYGWLSALVLKDGCTVELDATGYDSPGLGLDDCLLGVDHSTLKVKGGKGNRSIRAVTSFWMEGSEFESNHSYDKVNYMFLDATGKEATDEIIIAPIIKKTPMMADNSITIVDVDDTSATVAWMAATDDTTPQSELTYYIYSVKYGDSNFTGDAQLKGMTSYTYTNLQPGTTYYVSVKVVDKDGNQVFYQDASFTTTTPDTSAPALSDDEIRATKVTDKSISLEWTKASDDRTAEDQLVYEVVYADNSSFADNYLMVQMDKNTATLKNLTPSTTYYIKVSVSDEASNRSEYRVLSVKTVSSATAISTIAADDNNNSIMYNTSGIRVDKSFHGIVIKDGKKFFNK